MTTKPATRLREAFPPGTPVSLGEAAEVVGDEPTASAALTYLARRGDFARVRQRLWVRAGSPVDPFRMGARITSPYAFSYGSALSLHGVAPAERFEVLLSSPGRFDAFEFEGISYRRAMPWISEGLTRLSVGPEFVWTTSAERTVVECVRIPSNAGGLAELARAALGSISLDPSEVLRWVDHYGESVVAARLGFLLERSSELGSDLYPLLAELERRRPASRLYLDAGARGGRLSKRWNVIVPQHLLAEAVQL